MLPLLAGACSGPGYDDAASHALRILDAPVRFAPGIASTAHAEIRLTLSPDGRTALWFSRDRPGGAGGYDIWISRRVDGRWQAALPVSFNSPGRDFDPAFSADGRTVYFCSDRPGGMGGDDVWRVQVDGSDAAGAGFGRPVALGPSVNSAGDEFAPMLSADGRRLLFSSDRPGGAGGHDLYLAKRRADGGFEPAHALSGGLNTAANEFDPTFLQDDTSVVFARAMDLAKDRVDLFWASTHAGHYHAGTRLPDTINDAHGDTYGAMLDWSAPDRLLFSARRTPGPDAPADGMDLYRVRYRIGSDR
jgi:Tol biopolymer transport system component